MGAVFPELVRTNAENAVCAASSQYCVISRCWFDSSSPRPADLQPFAQSDFAPAQGGFP